MKSTRTNVNAMFVCVGGSVDDVAGGGSGGGDLVM